MKLVHVALFLLFLGLFSGCKTLQFDSQPTTNAKISPLKTYQIVKPEVGSYIFGAVTQDEFQQVTVDALGAQLKSKGYSLVPAGQAADLVVSPAWVISTQNNPVYEMNGGTYETAQQLPETIKVANLDVYVTDSAGNNLWQNRSPWPFSILSATQADIKNAAAWVMENFPVHQTTVSE